MIRNRDWKVRAAIKRVVVGGISHATSTFTPVETTLQSYHQRFLLREPDMLRVLRGTNMPLGGFIDDDVPITTNTTILVWQVNTGMLLCLAQVWLRSGRW